MALLFSVLVPVYNVEKYVAECIESVLGQRYAHFELILVDDGSTDKSGTICDEYAARDGRIHVFHKPNQGLIHTRRTAIGKATGDYYIFLDSDDMLKENALQAVADIIAEHECDCVIYGYERIKDGKVISGTKDTEELLVTEKEEVLKKCLFSTEMNSLCRKAVKATVFQDIDYSPYYHIQMSEDLLQSLEIYRYSQSFCFTNRKLYLYRVNTASITQKQEKVIVDYTVRKKVLEFIREEGVFSEELQNRYRDFCIVRVLNQIIRICLDFDKKNVKTAFEQIRKDDYYRLFLAQGITDYRYVGYRSMIYYLFRKQHDGILIFMIRAVHRIRKTR